MTDKEIQRAEESKIITLAILKAQKNGWNTDKGAREMAESKGLSYRGVYSIIFSHSFAKAFWGEGDKEIYPNQSSGLYRWQYYLQRMVLEEQPLKYLERFL